jgi:hypothetical protein
VNYDWPFGDYNVHACVVASGMLANEDWLIACNLSGRRVSDAWVVCELWVGIDYIMCAHVWLNFRSFMREVQSVFR